MQLTTITSVSDGSIFAAHFVDLPTRSLVERVSALTGEHLVGINELEPYLLEFALPVVG